MTNSNKPSKAASVRTDTTGTTAHTTSTASAATDGSKNTSERKESQVGRRVSSSQQRRRSRRKSAKKGSQFSSRRLSTGESSGPLIVYDNGQSLLSAELDAVQANKTSNPRGGDTARPQDHEDDDGGSLSSSEVPGAVRVRGMTAATMASEEALSTSASLDGQHETVMIEAHVVDEDGILQQTRRDIEEAIRRDVEDDVRQRFKNEGVHASEVVLIRRRRWLSVMAAVVILLFVGGFITATTVGKSKQSQNLFPDLPTPAPTVACAPSSSLPFTDIKDLYDAVDAYMLDPTNSTSEIAQLHGHPMRCWDVSSINIFQSVFSIERNEALLEFDEDLTGWDTSNATSLYSMFYKPEYETRSPAFSGKGLEFFNASNVRSLYGTFGRSTLMDANLSLWDVSNVESFRSTFFRASSFRGTGLSEWNTSSATTMMLMFYYAYSFDADLSKWDTSNCISMRQMFAHAVGFSGIGLSNFDVGNVRDMQSMFEGTKHLSADLSSWDTGNVIRMDNMFRGTTGLRVRGLSSWDISNVESMSNMFEGAREFSENLCSWGRRLSSSQNVTVTNMFAKSGCPVTSDPDLSANPPGPFCYPC